MASYLSKQQISTKGNFTPPFRGHLAMPEDMFGCQNWHLMPGEARDVT